MGRNVVHHFFESVVVGGEKKKKKLLCVWEGEIHKRDREIKSGKKEFFFQDLAFKTRPLIFIGKNDKRVSEVAILFDFSCWGIWSRNFCFYPERKSDNLLGKIK